MELYIVNPKIVNEVMKKIYVTPQVEINETIVNQMMALSLQNKEANDKDALIYEDPEWDPWN